MKNSKNLWITLVLALLLFASCSSKKEEVKTTETKTKTETVSEIKAFVSKEGNFSIDFPGEPSVETTPVDTEAGNINMTTFSYELSADEAMMLAYSDMPFAKTEEKDARELLKGEQGGALGSFGISAAEEEKQVDYKNYPGLFYKAKSPDGIYIVAQTYLIDSRLYQIEILSMTAYPTDEKVKGFIGSFKLLDE